MAMVLQRLRLPSGEIPDRERYYKTFSLSLLLLSFNQIGILWRHNLNAFTANCCLKYFNVNTVCNKTFASIYKVSILCPIPIRLINIGCIVSQAKVGRCMTKICHYERYQYLVGYDVRLTFTNL